MVAVSSLDLLVPELRVQRKRHRARADGLGVRKVSRAIAEPPEGLEQVQRLVVHADADAARVHRLDEALARGVERVEVDERREEVPGVAGVAGRRKAQTGDAAKLLQIAPGERAPARVEALEPRELGDADGRRNVAEVGFSGVLQHVHAAAGQIAYAVKAQPLGPLELAGIAKRERPTLD